MPSNSQIKTPENTWVDIAVWHDDYQNEENLLQKFRKLLKCRDRKIRLVQQNDESNNSNQSVINVLDSEFFKHFCQPTLNTLEFQT